MSWKRIINGLERNPLFLFQKNKRTCSLTHVHTRTSSIWIYPTINKQIFQTIQFMNKTMHSIKVKNCKVIGSDLVPGHWMWLAVGRFFSITSPFITLSSVWKHSEMEGIFDYINNQSANQQSAVQPRNLHFHCYTALHTPSHANIISKHYD